MTPLVGIAVERDEITNEHECIWDIVVTHMDSRGAYPASDVRLSPV